MPDHTLDDLKTLRDTSGGHIHETAAEALRIAAALKEAVPWARKPTVVYDDPPGPIWLRWYGMDGNVSICFMGTEVRWGTPRREPTPAPTGHGAAPPSAVIEALSTLTYSQPLPREGADRAAELLAWAREFTRAIGGLSSGPWHAPAPKVYAITLELNSVLAELERLHEDEP